MGFEEATFGWPSAFWEDSDSVHHACDPVCMAISGALDNRLLDLADEIYEEGKADGFALGLIEGARQALDAADIAARSELCDCGCGLTYNEIDYLDDAFAEARDEAEGCGCDFCQSQPEEAGDEYSLYLPDPIGDEIVLLTQSQVTEINERLEALEYEAGVKYVG